MGKLTALSLKSALSSPGSHSDGDGLILKMDKRGGAYWLCRLQPDGQFEHWARQHLATHQYREHPERRRHGECGDAGRVDVIWLGAFGWASQRKCRRAYY